MRKESKTFTLGERENIPEFCMFNEKVEIHYCSYCGEKAILDRKYEDRDRFDYYHCGCDTAKREMAMKEKIEESKNNLYKLQKELKEIQESEVSDLPNQIKAKNEIKRVLEKYKVTLKNGVEFEEG